MNYEKQYPVPKCASRVLRLPLSRLRAGDVVREFYLLHVKEGDRGLECAEGLAASTLIGEPKLPIVDLYATSDEVFALCAGEGKKRYLYGMVNARSYTDMDTGERFYISPATPILDYPLHQFWYVITSNNVWRCCTYEASKYLIKGRGGICGAEYAGRFFFFDADRLYYTKPYDETVWDLVEDGTMQTYGYIDMPSPCGGFLDCACFKDRFFIVCKKGVIKVKMGGKTIEGRIDFLPQNCGETKKGTAQTIGDKMFFFTERGLCSFDGETFRHLATPCSRRIDFSTAYKTGTWRGKYYAFAALDTGEKRVYVYDPLTERETFLRIDVEKFCAGYTAAAVKGGVIYELADKVLPENGDPCSICCKIAVNGGKPARIDWIRIEGSGEFEAEAATPEDGAARAKGTAGKTLPLTRSLYGSVLSLTISTRDADFLVTGIALGMGEVDDGD